MLDIDQSLLTFVHPPREELIAEARQYIAASKRRLTGAPAPAPLEPGRRVRHKIFGEGRVLEADPEEGTCTIQFDGMETPRQLSLAVKLEYL